MSLSERIIFVAVFLFISVGPRQAICDDQFDPKLFSSDAEFTLSSSSEVFPPSSPDESKLQTKNAFAVLTDEFFAGKTNALEIWFFADSLTDEGKSDILNNKGLNFFRKQDRAIMVLFLDKDHKIWQVNLTYIIPGRTAGYTVAEKPEDLKQFFSDYSYDGKNLKLKSKGSYNDLDQKKNPIHLNWDVDFNLPVFNKVGLPKSQ